MIQRLTSIFFFFFTHHAYSNMMSSQKLIKSTEEAVMRQGLSGVHIEKALLLWAHEHRCLLHPLVEARINEFRCSQMTEVDDSVMYNAESQIREKEPHPDGFSDTEDDLLYHAVSQIEALSASPTSPLNPQPDPPTSTLEARPEPPTSQIRQEVVQSDPSTTNVEALPEPPNFQGSDDTVILPDNDLLMTDSEYDTLFLGGTIQNSGVDETRILDEFTESNNPPVVSRQEDAPGGPQPDILRDAAAAAGFSPSFAVHWDDSIPEHQLAQALTNSPPSFESSRFDLIDSQQQTPKTQTFSDGNMNSALRHWRSVVELRQWAEEYQVAEHPVFSGLLSI